MDQVDEDSRFMISKLIESDISTAEPLRELVLNKSFDASGLVVGRCGALRRSQQLLQLTDVHLRQFLNLAA